MENHNVIRFFLDGFQLQITVCINPACDGFFIECQDIHASPYT